MECSRHLPRTERGYLGCFDIDIDFIDIGVSCRYFREISAISIPFDTVHLNIEGCFSAENQYFSAGVCAIALCSKEVSHHCDFYLRGPTADIVRKT